ncbi:MAG: 16S rRNA (uracil(1498)-N(3))-methyltransferase [Pirellulales bacterium]
MTTQPHTECAVYDAMPDRYFVETPITGRQARLEGAEAHHLANVMRAKPGQQVTLFDGSGAEFDARIESVGRSTVDLAIVDRSEVDRELARRITLAVALPKGDRQRWLVEKTTELGVARLVPLITSRSVAQPVETALARSRRAVVEASKQCGRNRLMEISQAVAFAEFVRWEADGAERWIAQPSDSKSRGGASPTARSQAEPGNERRALIVAVGPEGGFTDDEVRAAIDAGFSQLDLGPRILRVETAAIAVAAWAVLSGGEDLA